MSPNQHLGNVLLGIPFGFLVPFVWRGLLSRVLVAGLCFSLRHVGTPGVGALPREAHGLSRQRDGMAQLAPTRNRGAPTSPVGHDGALVRSTPTPGSPRAYVRAVNPAAAR
jgi:hypothetical protein